MREDQVRELLGLAGETIEVGPGAAVETPARKRWPYVAGAAAAAVAIAASVLVGVTLTGDRDDAAPGPHGDPGGATIRVAGVYGMPVDHARQQLEDQGLTVSVTHVETCDAPLGRSLGTNPPALSAVTPGTLIDLEVAMQGNIVDGRRTAQGEACDSGALYQQSIAWQFVDYLEGWAAPSSRAPGLAATTTYTENDNNPITVEGPTPDPAAFGALAERIRSQLALPGTYLRAALDNGRDYACAGLELPPRLQERQSLWFELTEVVDGVPLRCTMVNLVFEGIDPPGTITEVVLRFSDNPLLDGASRDAEKHAEDLQASLGESVAQRWLLSIQPESPISMSPYAEQVDLYLGNNLIKTLDAGSAHDAAMWEVCPGPSGYAGFACPFNAFETASSRTPDQVEVVDGPAESVCLERLEERPQRDQSFVVLSPRDYSMCSQQWFIELYYDADQRITAVNLLIGSL